MGFEGVALNKKTFFMFFVLVVLCAPFLFNQTGVVNARVGEYLNASAICNGNHTFVLGNGIFCKDNRLYGWPERIGVVEGNSSGVDISILIKPLTTEYVGDSSSSAYIEWSSPNKNDVYLSRGKFEIKNVSFGIPGVKWQLGASHDLNYIYWVNIVPGGFGDRIIVVDIKGDRRFTIGNDASIHRKPIVNGKYIYWYQDDTSSVERKIKIMRMRLTDGATEEEFFTSTYPNTITDYSVLSSGVVAITKKNYDQQRSDIVFLDGGSIVGEYYEDDSYIQNLMVKDNALLFEIKRHGQGFCTAKINNEFKNVGALCIAGKDVILSKDGKSVARSIGEDLLLTYETILERYSPPITGFSLYNNDYAALSITEAPVIISLLNVYKKTFERRYLYLAAERASNILKSFKQGREINERDLSGWGVKVFSDHNKPTSFLVHDAIIFDALLLVAKEMQNDPELLSRYPLYLNRVKNAFAMNFIHHSKQLFTFEDDAYDITVKGESYYVFPSGDGYKYDNVNLPFNMMNAYVRPLINYSELTGDAQYKEIAYSLGRLFKRHLQYDRFNNSYLWPYWWGMYDKGWENGTVSKNTPKQQSSSFSGYVDIDHASLDIRAVLSLKKEEKLFGEEDVSRFINRMLLLVDDNDYKTPLLVDGSIKSANYNSIEYLWGELSQYSMEAQCVFLKMGGRFPYVQDAYTPTARFELLGYSYMLSESEKGQCNIFN